MITEKINLTNEQILKLKEMYEKYEVVKFPAEFDSIDFVGAFNELKEWFKWDLDKYQYDHLTDSTESHTVKKFLNTASDTLFKGYDIAVFVVIVELAIIESAGLVHNSDLDLIEKSIEKFEDDGEIYGKLDPDYNSEFDTDKYSELAHYVLQEFNYTDYTKGLIRNRMGDDDFETFFRKYKAILRKHATSELSTVPECNPTVTTIDTMATNAVSLEAEYGLVPAAYLALQCNPVGLWYMYQQTGKYRSQFVDYSELDKSCDNMALNHIEAITRLMTKRTVYQMILQEMPEIGTAINGKTIKLKIAGYNASKVGLLAVKDDEHVLAIIYDMASDKAQGISGDKQNVDAWIAKKVAN